MKLGLVLVGRHATWLAPRAPATAVVVTFLLSLAISLSLVDCGPGGIEPAHVIGPATRVTCILLRAFTESGTLEEVCATADELAPLIEEIIAEREEKAPIEQTASKATVAFSFAAPPRRVPRRRCTQWQYLGGLDSGTRDADSSGGDASGGTASGRIGGGGDDGGQRVDGGGQRSDGGGSPSKP